MSATGAFVDRAGQLGVIGGASPLLGRLWAVLVLSPEPRSLSELCDAVGAAKSTVSVAIRRLEAAGLVTRSWRPGDRRDFYAVVDDVDGALGRWLDAVISPDLDALDAAGREVLDEAALPEAQRRLISERLRAVRGLTARIRGLWGG